MKKKLIVAAVAGALIAPAAALAQSSTVQIYGLFNVEYAPYVDNPDHPVNGSRNRTDEINSGASRIGFKGEEKLGGGLSAWFQCESDVQFLDGGTADMAGVWCDRNSALGLKGSWGNFFIGTWDSPLKQVTSATRMLNETGWFGAQRLLLSTTADDPLGSQNYSTRNWGSLNYSSPNMNGFSINGQVTAGNPARNSLETQPEREYRHWGLNGLYRNGPWTAGLGWSRIENQGIDVYPGAPLAAQDGRDDNAYALGINYAWSAFKFGFLFTRLELERGTVAAPIDLERDSYNFALEWKLGGPGMVRFGITHAGETDAGVACGNCGSATQYQVSYNHSLSKRTTATVGFVILDNGSGGHYNLQALTTGSANVRGGDKASALAFGLQHTF